MLQANGNELFYRRYDGEEWQSVPSKVVVCGRCGGTGAHVNPNIDSNGLPDECVEDPDFMEGYLNGVYDVKCEECSGNNVVRVLDEEYLQGKNPTLLEDIHEDQREESEYQAECEMERLMGA